MYGTVVRKVWSDISQRALFLRTMRKTDGFPIDLFVFFMVQFQEIECHTNEIPFYRNIGISSGQESAEVHILVNRGECALRRWMKYLETSSLLDTVFHWLFVSLLLMIVLFFDRAVFTVRTFVDNLYNLLASCCTS